MNKLAPIRDAVVKIGTISQTLHSQMALHLYASAEEKMGVLPVSAIAQRLELARKALNGVLPEPSVESRGEGDAQSKVRRALPDIVRLTTSLYSQAASNTYGTQNDEMALSTQEIKHRLGLASDVLHGRAPLMTAGLMVESYGFDPQTGISTFTIPAGVSDDEAMRAINAYFRTYHSIPWGMPFREAITAEVFEWFASLADSSNGLEPLPCREHGTARHIAIHSIAKGTIGLDLQAQSEMLQKSSLVFADPRDLAIASGLHACKRNGQDLFADQEVRCSRSGVVLYCDWRGLRVRCNVADDAKNLAAAGTPITVSE
ncbi:MAG: hypothetical protein RL518_1634 [Pseudomonadota bacterium]|jgi:hypothetical protein